MPALCPILNSAYYPNNYAGIFDANLVRNCVINEIQKTSSKQVDYYTDTLGEH